jgi:hypothetical protein
MKNCKPIEVSQPPIGVAGFACLVCLAVVYLATRPVVSWLDVWWARILIYSVIPISVAFFILYRSSWHQEWPRLRRILSMILSSCIIFICVLFIGSAIIATLLVAFSRLAAFKD